ncbi:MAG: hypothetical protein PVG34_09610 [Desulfobacterales bacterium]
MPIEMALPSKLVEFPLRVTDPPGCEDPVSITVGGPEAAHAVNRKIKVTISLEVRTFKEKGIKRKLRGIHIRRDRHQHSVFRQVNFLEFTI